MRTVIFLAALLYFCNPVKAQYKYYQYKDMAVLYDSVKKVSGIIMMKRQHGVFQILQ